MMNIPAIAVMNVRIIVQWIFDMNPKPINLKAWEVNAYLDGRKTQKRVVIKPQPEFRYNMLYFPRNNNIGFNPDILSGITGEEPVRQTVTDVVSPYKIGQLLWVREPYCIFPESCKDGMGEQLYLKANQDKLREAEEHMKKHKVSWRPSIHIPRWASRLTLEVVGIRVERLQDISEADAVAEGVECDSDGWIDYLMPNTQCCNSAYESYSTLWQSLNDPESRNAKSWVWVIETVAHKRNVDEML